METSQRELSSEPSRAASVVLIPQAWPPNLFSLVSMAYGKRRITVPSPSEGPGLRLPDTNLDGIAMLGACGLPRARPPQRSEVERPRAEETIGRNGRALEIHHH